MLLVVYYFRCVALVLTDLDVLVHEIHALPDQILQRFGPSDLCERLWAGVEPSQVGFQLVSACPVILQEHDVTGKQVGTLCSFGFEQLGLYTLEQKYPLAA